jgi:hypothetical protein
MQRTAEGLHVGVRHVEERLHDRGCVPARRDPGQTVEAAAADQVQEHRLGLVVQRVPLRDRNAADRASNAVAGVHARDRGPRLDGLALPRRAFGLAEVERQTEARTDPAHVGGVFRAVGPQAVIEVEHLDADPQQATQVPQ